MATIKRIPILEDGYYKLILRDAKDTVSKKGNHMIALTYTTEDGVHTIKDWITYDDSTIALEIFLNAIGIEFGDDGFDTAQLAELIGVEVSAKVSSELFGKGLIYRINEYVMPREDDTLPAA